MNSRRILLALAATALVFLAGLGWLVLRGERSASAQAAAASEEAVHAASGPDVAADAVTGDASSHERRAARASATIARALPPFAEVDGLRLIVLEPGTRAPVPGAVVHVWECPSEEWGLTLDYSEWIGPDLEAHMAAKGSASTTDEHGEVDLPPSRHMRFVTARSGDSFAFQRFGEGDRGSGEVVLKRSHSFQVRVLDERRAPRAHAVVGLGYCDDPEAFWKVETDERGLCRVKDVEVILAERGIDPNTPFAVFVAVPCSPRVEEWIDSSHLPTGEITLVLPATGSIRVKIVDESGHVMPLSGRVTLSGQTDGESGSPRFGSEGLVAHADIVDGVARIPDVGLGLSFDVEADLYGTGDVSGFTVGPALVNQEVTLALPFAGDHTLLSGQLVDEDGHPLANRTFDWRRILDDGLAIQASGRDKLKTDGEGRFTWTLRRSAAATGVSTHRTGYLCEDVEGAVRAQATIRFPLEINQAATDLGAITVKRGGPLVNGQVVDDAGRGLAGILIVPRIHSSEGYQDADTFDAQLTDREGRFALFGPCLGLDLRVHAEGPGIVDAQVAKVPCQDGPVELTLRAQSFGGLEGSALVDHDAGDELIVIFERDGPPPAGIAPDGDQNPLEYADWWRAGDRICFRFSAVRPGRAHVRFHSPTEETPACLVVSDLEIVGGTTARPLSLIDVDLRGKVTKRTAAEDEVENVDYTVVDVAGHPIARGVVWTWSEDGDWDAQRFFAGGRLRVTTNQVRKLEIWAPGHRAHVLQAPFTGGRIVLGPMIELDVRVELPREFSDEHWSFMGRIWPVEKVTGDVSVPLMDGTFTTVGEMSIPSQAAARIAGFRVDHKGRGVVNLPAAGEYGLSLELTHTGSPESTVEGYAIAIEPATVTVRDADGRQVVQVRITPEALKQCLDDLGLSK